MVTKTQALKELYVALGGDAADVAEASTVTKVLNAIARLSGEDIPDASNAVKAIQNIASTMEGSFGGELTPGDLVPPGDGVIGV